MAMQMFDSQATTSARAAAAAAHTVFIDTNLDTHLVMMVTDDDTVGDFKQKLLIEHPRCFPKIGEITIHSLKVRRNGCFYHLSNQMLLKSAFTGVKKSWFLHVDAASCHAIIQSESVRDPSAQAERNNICTNHISLKVPVPGLDDSSVPQVGSSGFVDKLVPFLGPGIMGEGMPNDESLGGKFLDNEHHKSSSSHSLVSGESKKKSNSTANLEKMDSIVNSLGNNVRKESYKEESGNSHKDLSKEADATISPHNTPLNSGEFLDKEIHCSPFKEIGEGNSIPCLPLGGPHGISAANEVPSADTGGAGGSKLEAVVDGAEKRVEFGGRKTKKSRKHRIESANEAETNSKDGGGSSNLMDAAGIIEAEDPENKRRKKAKKNKDADAKSHVLANVAKDSISLISSHEKSHDGDHYAVLVDGKGDDCIGSKETDKTEVGKALLQNGGPKMVTDAENTNIKDIEGSSKSFDAARTTETQAPTEKRKQKSKSKKIKTSNAKSNISTSGVKRVKEHVESAAGAVQSVSEPDKAFLQDDPGIETKKGDNSFSQTEVLKASTLTSLDGLVFAADNQDGLGSRHEDDFLQLTQAVRVQETTDTVKNKSTLVSTSTSPTILDPGLKQQVAQTEYPSITTKEKKEEEKASSKKIRKSKTKKDSSVNQLSSVMPEAENGGGHGDDSLQLSQVVRVQETVHKVKRNSVKPSSSTPNSILDTVIKQEVAITEDPSLSTKENKEETAALKKIRKSKPKKDSSVNELSDMIPEAVNNGNKIEFIDYFVHKNDNPALLLLLLPPAPAPARELDVHLASTASDLEKSHSLVNNQGHAKSVKDVTSDAFQFQQRKRKPSSSENASFTSRDDSSKDIKPASAVQIHYSSGAKVQNSSKVKKPSETEDMIVISHNQKSSLAAPNRNVIESSTESSEDDESNSDTSTLSPSDTSSSSDHSDGENEMLLNSSGNESHERKVMGNGGSSIKSQITPLKRITAQKNRDFDEILKKSRSYRRAKLTASQSQPEDDGSQPIRLNFDS
ncbi:hypothetical protein IFM89_034001 [Coptis chinensis]|uniref:Uncharacterized protein n=1 Tax=Coptis chinensis TaxID=261450 RepID=A0A835MGE3_9MAGN|nr:hypothetical protein IFM89_034001 [Coptis chinensis]